MRPGWLGVAALVGIVASLTAYLTPLRSRPDPAAASGVKSGPMANTSGLTLYTSRQPPTKGLLIECAQPVS